MKKFSILFAIIFALTTGCSERSPEADAALGAASNSSGSTDSGDSSGDSGGGSTSQPTNTSTSVIVITDNSLIETGGSEIAKITALVKDKNNVLVEGESVSFSATGGSLKVNSSTTAEDGTATAELGLDGDPMNQDITVSATADGVTATVSVKAAGTGIVISGPAAMVAGDTADITATLSAGNGEPISNEVITFSSANSNSVTPESAITDENGQVAVVAGSTAGSDTITASAMSGNITATYSLNVADDLLTFVSPAAGKELSVGSNHTVQVKWFSNGSAVVGQDLVFGVTAGQVVGSSTATTDSNGVASIQVSSVSAGLATITVEGTGANDPATKLEVEYVATTPATVTLNAAPRVVDTNGDSVLTATVLDVNLNPVKGKTVRFETAQAFGGIMSPSAITDSNGEATVTFSAGALSTEEDELVIVSTVANTSVSDSVSLTINKRELNVTIGTTDNLRDMANETQYSQPYVVQVADGSGQPVKNATVRVTYVPLSYGKGQYRLYDTDVPTNGDADVWARFLNTDFIECTAEDANGNGTLDAGEDNNGNGKLDPQNPAVLAADDTLPTLQSGSITTDENGFGYFALVYPQSNSAWTTVSITASATAQNAEATASYVSYLPLLASELEDINSSLPNTRSPHGTSLSCSNAD